MSGKAVGERHGGAKLTEEQVIAIRKRYAKGGITQQVLGELHGVGQTAIRDIVNYKTWN